MEPKRFLSGGLIMPYRVVAPMNVNGLTARFMLRAFSPFSKTQDTNRSSMAG